MATLVWVGPMGLMVQVVVPMHFLFTFFLFFNIFLVLESNNYNVRIIALLLFTNIIFMYE